MISAVVCADNNWGIGKDNDLLVHIPEDLKMFKELTTNSIVIMGRKTYDSLPKKPLPNRINIVITSNHLNYNNNDDNVIFCDIKHAKDFLSNQSNSYKNIFVIGGASIYNELLPYCEKIYLTRVYHAFDGSDTFFPNISLMPEWKMTTCSEIYEYNKLKFQFCLYERKE